MTSPAIDIDQAAPHNPDLALALASSWTLQEPENPRAWSKLERVHHRSRRFSEAALAPAHPEAGVWLGERLHTPALLARARVPGGAGA